MIINPQRARISLSLFVSTCFDFHSLGVVNPPPPGRPGLQAHRVSAVAIKLDALNIELTSARPLRSLRLRRCIWSQSQSHRLARAVSKNDQVIFEQSLRSFISIQPAAAKAVAL